MVLATYGPTVEQNQFNNFGDRNVARIVLYALAPMLFAVSPRRRVSPPESPAPGDFKGEALDWA